MEAIFAGMLRSNREGLRAARESICRSPVFEGGAGSADEISTAIRLANTFPVTG